MVITGPEDNPLFVAGDGTHLREVLHPQRSPGLAIGYSLAHAYLEPGESSLPHRLAASEVYYFLDGQGVMRVGDDKQEVSAGCTVYVPPGATQHVTNTGSTRLTFLCIVDPAWRAEDEEVDNPPAAAQGARES